MSKSKVIVLKDKEVKWAFVNHTHNKYESTEQEYSINVVLTEADYKKLQKLGLQKGLKNVDNGKGEVAFTKDVISRTGKEMNPCLQYTKSSRMRTLPCILRHHHL